MRAATSPYVQQFTIKSHLHSWTVNKVTFPVTRCLLTSSNSSHGIVMCDQQYNETIIQDVWQILIKHKPAIGSLDLICALDDQDADDVYKTCVCSSIVLESGSHNVTVAGNLQNDTYMNQSNTDQSSMEQSNTPFDNSSDSSDVVTASSMTFTPCTYPEVLTRQMLLGYYNLNVLSIRHLPIKAIEYGAFDDFQMSLQVIEMTDLSLREDTIPDALLCHTNLYFVSLNNLTNVMKAFPRKMFWCNNTNESSGLSKLLGVFANGNSFQELPSLMVGQGAKSLLVLNITSNGISRVDVEAFQGMASLEELNMDRNLISNIPVGVFMSLTSLKYLSLQHNRLEYLDLSIFQALTALNELNLSENKLKSIDGSFSILPRLRNLYLEDNQLSEINSTMFADTSYISSLYMGHNFISYIHHEALSSLFFLRKLELKYNRLYNATNIQHAFQGNLQYLQYLGLSNNELTELLPRQFQKYTYVHKLRILDLTYNKIKIIDEDCLLDMDELENIALSHNEIAQFKAGTFSRLTSLLTLWIDDNLLEDIPDGAIPPKVLWLSLVDNKIQTFPRMSEPLPNLLHMYIGDNNISQLSNSTFLSYPSLTLLNMTNIGLEDLSEGIFDNLKDLQVLDLSKKPTQSQLLHKLFR